MKLFLLLSLLSPASSHDGDVKTNALHVLQEKCNVCHVRQNPFKVFNERNMEKHASGIYKQVFLKNRMPKGNEIKLTAEERETLYNWLTAQLKM
ncbi:hypothetical protein [Chitinophaga solisilvae]|uniref:hypothetical protein n=1 Tax=Chitinophaga solisilvae TaxID=1233460 RepID=UPI00136CFC91|nr:hypothetical protein [Chitinophaga solisilvae]